MTKLSRLKLSAVQNAKKWNMNKTPEELFLTKYSVFMVLLTVFSSNISCEEGYDTSCEASDT